MANQRRRRGSGKPSKRGKSQKLIQSRKPTPAEDPFRKLFTSHALAAKAIANPKHVVTNREHARRLAIILPTKGALDWVNRRATRESSAFIINVFRILNDQMLAQEYLVALRSGHSN